MRNHGWAADSWHLSRIGDGWPGNSGSLSTVDRDPFCQPHCGLASATLAAKHKALTIGLSSLDRQTYDLRRSPKGRAGRDTPRARRRGGATQGSVLRTPATMDPAHPVLRGKHIGQPPGGLDGSKRWKGPRTTCQNGMFPRDRERSRSFSRTGQPRQGPRSQRLAASASLAKVHPRRAVSRSTYRRFARLKML
jgi:hypothetical protein